MRVFQVSKIAAGALLAGLMCVTGCGISSRRAETLQEELGTARRLLEESRAEVRRLEEQAAVSETSQLTAKVAELDGVLEKQVAMNDELEVRTVELEKLWSDSQSHCLALSRQIYVLRKEKDRLQLERDDLFARQRSGAPAADPSDRSLSEVDVRIAELKGVCLYYPAGSFAAREAKTELNHLQARRLVLLNPKEEDRQAPWAEKVIPPDSSE